MTKSLFEFPSDVWDEFKNKIHPYKSQQYVVEQLVRIFIGLKADKKVENELRRLICK